tara:strand:- start:30 stop:728 length:699 start_codon:yes stop_codon:yes gene_type:complete
MLDENPRAKVGGNSPPNPIEACTQEWGDLLSEVEHWTDGEPVTDEAGMKAVDDLLKQFKAYKSALKAAGELITKPLHEAHTEAVASVKVYTADATRIQESLVATVAPFKAELAAKKEADRRAAWQAAQDAKKKADEIEAQANAASLDDQRAADDARRAAMDLQKAASVAQKDTVKGMRTVKTYEITDHKAALHWIAAQDRAAMTQFIEEYVRRNFKTAKIDGVTVTVGKEAY